MTDQTTHQPLTDQQLDEIEARATAATRGPWRQDDFAEIKSPDGDTIADYWEPTHDSENGAFIAHARTDVPALLAEVRRLRAELAGPHAETLRTAGWIECSPEWLAANPGQCATAARVPGGTAVSHWHPASEQPAAAASEACGKCKQPFDPADTRFDGRARYHLTPYCRGCVDRCHDTEIADHRCVICA